MKTKEGEREGGVCVCGGGGGGSICDCEMKRGREGHMGVREVS